MCYKQWYIQAQIDAIDKNVNIKDILEWPTIGGLVHVPLDKGFHCCTCCSLESVVQSFGLLSVGIQSWIDQLEAYIVADMQEW